MKRRVFITLLAASAAAPLVPLQLTQAASFLESREFSPIDWYEEWWDYDNILSISGKFPDGRRYASSMVIRPKDATEEVRDYMKRSLIRFWEESEDGRRSIRHTPMVYEHL